MNSNKNFTVFISTEHKSLLVSICEILEKNYNYNVRIIARDKYVKKFISKFRKFKDTDIVFNDFKIQIEDSDIIEHSSLIEKKYDFNFSMAILEDRGLGQGYLFNVTRHPNIGKSTWSHEKKIKYILEDFLKFEKILQDTDVYIGRWANKLVSSIMDYNNKKYFCLASVRLGDRRFWSDDNYITSSILIKSINEIKNQDLTNYKDVEYKVDKYTKKANTNFKMNYTASCKEFLKIFYKNTKSLIRRNFKRDSYGYLGWAPPAFRRVNNYKFVKKIAKQPKDLINYDIIYLTLHLEPEVSTLAFTPEFNNSMEIISIISKCIPTSSVLVVKEHIHSFGVRSKSYYKLINKIGNVFWSYPDIDSHEWLEKSKVIVSMTGTVGFEAVYFKKPVISFGKHQLINNLNTVFYCNNYFDCKKAIKTIYDNKFTDEDFEHSKKVLSKTQFENSFELEGHAETKNSSELVLDIAKKALENLFKNFF